MDRIRERIPTPVAQLAAGTDQERSRAESRIAEILLEGDPETTSEVLRGLSLLSRSDPDPVVGVLPRVVDCLDHPDGAVRNQAVRVLARIAERRPGAVDPFTQRIVDVFEDDEYGMARSHALAALAELPDIDTPTVMPMLPSLLEVLDGEYADDRKHAVKLMRRVAETDPGELTGVVSELVTVVGEGPRELHDGEVDHHPMLMERLNQDRLQREGVREIAAEAVREIAEAAPRTVEPYLTDLRPCLTDRNPTVRVRVLRVFAVVGEQIPGVTLEAVDDVIGALTRTDDADTHMLAIRILSAMAETEPDTVTAKLSEAGDIETIATLLRSDHAGLRAAAAGLLGYVAESDPGRVQPVIPKLKRLLDDPEGVVRGNAALTLGFTGHRAVESELEALRTDPEQVVREAARDALNELRTETKGA